MHFVLAVPPARDLEAAARALASLAGGLAIDQRQTLLKNVPLIPLWSEDLAQVQAAADALRAAGLDAWALHERAMTAVPEIQSARLFALEPDALVTSDRIVQTRIAFADVLLILRARVDSQVQTLTETTKKANHVQTLLTGIPSRAKVTQERQTEGQQQAFALVYTATTAVRLPCDGMDFSGMGQHMQAGALANYQRLIELLVAACPQATFDPRLERVAGRLPVMPGDQKRMTAQQVKPGITKRESSLAYDNEDAVMRAARLLYLAERKRRLATR